MARRLTNGAELQTVAIGTTGGEQISAVTGTPDIETTTVRSGAASYHCVSTEQLGYQFTTSANPVFWGRIYFRINTGATVDGCQILIFRVGVNRKVGVRLYTDEHIELWNEEDNTQISTDSGALTEDVWYRLEVGVNCTTLSSTSVETRLALDSDPDTELWNVSGTANLSVAPNELQFGASNFGGTVDLFFDDIACNDNVDDGTGQNSWCGPGEQVILRPNGNGDSSQWTGSDGNSTDNYLLVDELPVNTSDYVESNTSGQIDHYALTATPAAMDSDDEILLVQVGVYLAVSNASGGDPDFVAGMELGGSTAEGSAIDANSTTWWPNVPSTIPFPYTYSANTKPGGGAWTKSDLDSAQVRLRETVTDTHFARVSAVWVYVEHKPAPAGGTEYTQDASGGVTPSGALLKQTNKPVVGSLTPAGALFKDITKTFSGSITPTGVTNKLTSKTFSGAITPTGDLSAAHLIFLLLSGAITPSGAISKLIGTSEVGALIPGGAMARETATFKQGSITPSGDSVKQTNKDLSGSLTPSGLLETIRLFIKVLSGDLTPTGAITKLTATSEAGALLPGGTNARETQTHKQGAITPAGAANKSTTTSFSGSLTPSGILDVIRLFVMAVSGALTPTGAITKLTSKSPSGTLPSSGGIDEQISKFLVGSLTPTGTEIRQISKFFSGALTPIGSLARLFLPGGGVATAIEDFFRGMMRGIFRGR